MLRLPLSQGRLLPKQNNAELVAIAADSIVGRGIVLLQHDLRINSYGKQSGVSVEHYVISSGIREMVAGTSIGRKFKAMRR